jgi:heptose I phosphotransferase
LQQSSRDTQVYLKRHTVGKMGQRTRVRRQTGNRRLSPGPKEFDNICSFRKHGLATVVPIAAGEKRSSPDGIESFILTEDFSPYVQLEALQRDEPGFFMGEAGVSRKETLLTEIAQLAGRMHCAGFNHRDFNATHILLLYKSGSDTPRLALFDLERVEVGGRCRCRWPIKSIARLNYTLPEEIFSPRDRKHLWMAYKGKESMDLWDMAQWIWIQRKTKRIARHTAKIMDRRRKAAKRTPGDA